VPLVTPADTPKATHCAECGEPIATLANGERAPCALWTMRSGTELAWCSPECLDAPTLRSNPTFASRELVEATKKPDPAG
jgi:hypothetical protein